jgi:hypothetical protein
MSPPGSAAAFDSFNQIATVHIELRDTDPVIWRQVEVPTSITLKVLHHIIQAAMGWFDYHLWEFTIDKRRYGLPTDEDWGTKPRSDAAKVRLRNVLYRRRRFGGGPVNVGFRHLARVSPADLHIPVLGQLPPAELPLGDALEPGPP